MHPPTDRTGQSAYRGVGRCTRLLTGQVLYCGWKVGWVGCTLIGSKESSKLMFLQRAKDGERQDACGRIFSSQHKPFSVCGKFIYNLNVHEGWLHSVQT